MVGALASEFESLNFYKTDGCLEIYENSYKEDVAKIKVVKLKLIMLLLLSETASYISFREALDLISMSFSSVRISFSVTKLSGKTVILL